MIYPFNLFHFFSLPYLIFDWLTHTQTYIYSASLTFQWKNYFDKTSKLSLSELRHIERSCFCFSFSSIISFLCLMIVNMAYYHHVAWHYLFIHIPIPRSIYVHLFFKQPNTSLLPSCHSAILLYDTSSSFYCQYS